MAPNTPKGGPFLATSSAVGDITRIHEGFEAASSPHDILRLPWGTQYYDPIPAAGNDPALWLPRGHTSWQRRPQVGALGH